jgi:hypothetical protein
LEAKAKRKTLKTLQGKAVEDRTRELVAVSNLYDMDWEKILRDKLKSELDSTQTHAKHFGKGIVKNELDFFEQNKEYLFEDSSSMWH